MQYFLNKLNRVLSDNFFIFRQLSFQNCDRLRRAREFGSFCLSSKALAINYTHLISCVSTRNPLTLCLNIPPDPTFLYGEGCLSLNIGRAMRALVLEIKITGSILKATMVECSFRSSATFFFLKILQR